MGGLHTYIRNRDTPRDEFIFYSKRLIRLVIEYSLSLLPYKSVTVDTPQGQQYEGRQCTASNICGVSILRAGETMEQDWKNINSNQLGYGGARTALFTSSNGYKRISDYLDGCDSGHGRRRHDGHQGPP